MAKKRAGRTKTKRAKKTKRRVSRSKPKVSGFVSTKRKINLALRNLLLFLILTLISFLFYNLFQNNAFFQNLFLLLSIIFLFVGVAFLIVFLVFLILKAMKK